MRFARWLVLSLVMTACSSGGPSDTTDAAFGPVVHANQGGALEGHTPRGFAGMGTGLFVGDNINSGFPEGDGVQTYLTFDLTGIGAAVTSAVLASDAMTVRGSPFEDLGPLMVEVVRYETFGPELFDLGARSSAVTCDRVGDSGITCDVTDMVGQAVAGGEARVQFRLRFDRAGDGDGASDLAMFFLADPNTNEPGIFTLEID